MTNAWRTIAEAEALAAAGPSARVESVEATTFALGRWATVVIVAPGDRPDGSCVTSVDDVVLRGPFPVPIAERLSGGDLPDRPILGYVRMPEGCLPLGQMRVVMLHHEPFQIPGKTKGVLRECRLWLKDTLPYEVIDRIRPTPPENLPGLAWLELAPHDPIGALRDFVAGWYASVPAVSAEPLAATLPAPLVEFYRIAAGRPQILGVQNEIYPPDRIRPEGDAGLVRFGMENQGVFQLLMDPTAVDPPVLYDEMHGAKLVAEREPLSGYLLQFALLEAVLQGPYGGWAAVDEQHVQRFVAPLRRVPLQPLRWPADPTQLYAAEGLVAMVSECGDGWFELYVGSRYRSALKPLREPGFAWDTFID